MSTHSPDAAPDPAAALEQAIAHHVSGRLELAHRGYRDVIARDPRSAQAHGNLGHVLLRLGAVEAAVLHLRRALELRPDYAAAHNNLGTALKGRGELAAALGHFQEAARAEPHNAAARYNLAQALLESGHLDEALPHYGAALELHPPLLTGPAHATFENNLAVALMNRGRMGEAREHLQRALACDGGCRLALRNLGALLLRCGCVREAAACYERALREAGAAGDRQAEDLLLLLSHYDDTLCSADESAARHAAWGARVAAAAPRPAPYGNGRDPSRRLRVGYVSANFHQHAVTHFFEPLLQAHDRRRVEVLCYTNTSVADAATARLRASADGWREIHGLDDAAAERLIREDRIDVLVDLNGHTDENRLALFARRPAPVEVSYLGYPGTSGLRAITCRFTDEWADPPGVTEALHSEALWRLPGGFNCYQPPADCPEEGPPPVLDAGHVTFASFNVLAKTTPRVVAAWAAVLRAVPRARLLLKTATLGDGEVRGRVLGWFAAHGVGAERLELHDFTPSSRDHMALYHRVDVALDTFPYNGTTTTCDALWMGVPVVALAGRVHAARVGVSLLSRVGLPELVAASPAEYVAIAARLAGDPGGLGRLRAGLRDRVARSPLRDAPRLARAVEDGYAELWRRGGGRAERGTMDRA